MANTFLTKVAQIFGDYLGYFENIPFQVKTAAVTFFKNGLLLIQTSGHTACDSKSEKLSKEERNEGSWVHNLFIRTSKKNSLWKERDCTLVMG